MQKYGKSFEDLSHFRPIYLLNSTCKLYETTAIEGLEKGFKNKDVSSEHQYGFSDDKSSTNAGT